MSTIYAWLTKSKYARLFPFVPILHIVYPVMRIILHKYLYRSKEYSFSAIIAWVLFTLVVRFLNIYVGLIILYALVSVLALAAKKRLSELELTQEIREGIFSWNAIRIPVIVASILIMLTGAVILHSSRVSDAVPELYEALRANDLTEIMDMIHPKFRSEHKDFMAERHAAARAGLFEENVELNRTYAKITYSGSDTITYYLYEIVCEEGVYSLELEHLHNSRGSGFTVIDFSVPEDQE